jgi:hypothetical protein
MDNIIKLTLYIFYFKPSSDSKNYIIQFFFEYHNFDNRI